MMKILLIFLLFVIISNGESAKLIKVRNAIPGQYIVVLKAQNTRTTLKQMINEYEDQKVTRTFKSMLGYAAKFDDDTREKLLNDSRVEFIEPVQPVNAFQFSCSATQTVNEYFLPRISFRSPGTTYRFPASAGGGVIAYVLDTGIKSDHTEFTGRMLTGASFVGGDTGDVNGHGTCCAGILGGTQLGVAKNVKLVPVKVLGDSGSGSTAGIISGIDYAVTDTRVANSKKIVSMSLGGSFSISLNLAVEMAVAKGIAVFAAAGNDGLPVWTTSPASALSAITVAASDSNNKLASFSNYGFLVDIIAPGVGIKCAGVASTTDFVTETGTSMACPMAAGAGALILGQSTGVSPKSLTSSLIQNSQPNVIGGIGLLQILTPNRLLYTGCTST